MKTLVHENGNFELNSVLNRQPVEMANYYGKYRVLGAIRIGQRGRVEDCVRVEWREFPPVPCN